MLQLHFGGGTPNFLSPGQLVEVIDSLAQLFNVSRSPGATSPSSWTPAMSTTRHRRAGTSINQASLGIQDFDPQVQQAVNRIQPVAQTLAVIDSCRRHGLRSVNVDLIYGLPRQTAEALPAPWTPSSAPGPIAWPSTAMPTCRTCSGRSGRSGRPTWTPEAKLGLLALAIDKLTAAGYRYIGMDHFALPDDDLAGHNSAATCIATSWATPRTPIAT